MTVASCPGKPLVASGGVEGPDVEVLHTIASVDPVLCSTLRKHDAQQTSAIVRVLVEEPLSVAGGDVG
jgi:hypothetical protein